MCIYIYIYVYMCVYIYIYIYTCIIILIIVIIMLIIVIIMIIMIIIMSKLLVCNRVYCIMLWCTVRRLRLAEGPVDELMVYCDMCFSHLKISWFVNTQTCTFTCETRPNNQLAKQTDSRGYSLPNALSLGCCLPRVLSPISHIIYTIYYILCNVYIILILSCILYNVRDVICCLPRVLSPISRGAAAMGQRTWNAICGRGGRSSEPHGILWYVRL